MDGVTMSLVVDVALSMRHGLVPNYIAPGLNSHLLGSDKEHKYGSLRMFENTREQEFFITPHTHRFNFACCVLRGHVWNTVYTLVNPDNPEGQPYLVSKYFKETKSTEPVDDQSYYYTRKTSCYGVNDWYHMQHKQFHTIRFSVNALVLFLEGAHETETSLILEPVVDGVAVNTFKVEPWMYNSKPVERK